MNDSWSQKSSWSYYDGAAPTEQLNFWRRERGAVASDAIADPP